MRLVTEGDYHDEHDRRGTRGPAEPARLSADPGTGDLALTSAREARVGDVIVRRLLPLRQRRSVGAWCFVDHYGRCP